MNTSIKTLAAHIGRQARLVLLLVIVVSLLAQAQPAAADYIIAQENATTYSSGPLTRGQSFTTTGYGRITRIDFYAGDMKGMASELRIYLGANQFDDPAMALYSQPFTVNCSYCWYSISLTTPFEVDANAVYTFEIKDANLMYANDSYAGGTAWLSNTAQAAIDLAFRVFVNEYYYVLKQEDGSFTYTDYVPRGQSFTVTNSGRITKIDIYTGEMKDRATQLRIYPGAQQPDNAGLALYTQMVTPDCSNCWYSIILTTPLRVRANAVYTFEIKDASLHYLDKNVYPGGTAWYLGTAHPSEDLAFRVFVGNSFFISLPFISK